MIQDIADEIVVMSGQSQNHHPHTHLGVTEPSPTHALGYAGTYGTIVREGYQQTIEWMK